MTDRSIHSPGSMYVLPPVEEIERMLAGDNPPNLREIGDRYGVSRQSVHQKLMRHRAKLAREAREGHQTAQDAPVVAAASVETVGA